MYTFRKAERLCSASLFKELLSSGCSFVQYPFRVVAKQSSSTGKYPARIALSVSKKKFKRAVKRNRVKRLVREAYRLNKPGFYQRLVQGRTIDILFIFLDQNLPTYSKTDKAIKSALQKIPDLFPVES